MYYYKHSLDKIHKDIISHSKIIEFIAGRIWNSSQFNFNEINTSLEHVPSMLTIEEKKMLNWLTRYYVTGEGQIVDLGAFLGGSTIQLANGLNNNAVKNDKKVYSYDRFEFNDEYKEKWLYPNGQRKFKTNNVLPIVKRYLTDYKNLVKFYKGEFLEQKWKFGQIELLFIDIAKTWELTDVITNQFFPNLIPGKSIIIQQDMLFVNCPWVSAVMFRLKDHFEFITATEHYSVLFLHTETVTPEVAMWANSEKFTPRDVINGLDYFIEKFQYFPHKEILQDCKNRFINKPHATKAWQL